MTVMIALFGTVGLMTPRKRPVIRFLIMHQLTYHHLFSTKSVNMGPNLPKKSFGTSKGKQGLEARVASSFAGGWGSLGSTILREVMFLNEFPSDCSALPNEDLLLTFAGVVLPEDGSAYTIALSTWNSAVDDGRMLDVG